MNIAVFVSGNGTNLQAIIDAISRGEIKAKIALVVSDNKDAYALARAKKANIETFILSAKGFKNREDYDKEIIKELEKRSIRLVVLAGFMRLLSPYFVRRYKNKIMNIHPALLPSFKGTHGIKDAFEYGAAMSGVTVHFVDEELDHGPIILQEAVSINESDTLETLEEKIHKVEHRLYPKAVRLFVEGKLKIKGRKVIQGG
ncbi:MAG: phosphoribosylglycinamide formyltransferase [Candidatus Omnitrophota bacterium]|nr:MAG: phosphoribosylglycinamide formyltransferase [Candidatus Omnitrophota bacterium]